MMDPVDPFKLMKARKKLGIRVVAGLVLVALFLTAAFSAGAFSAVPSLATAQSGIVGVSVGDWFKYDWSMQATGPNSTVSVTGQTVYNVTNVSGTIITVNETVSSTLTPTTLYVVIVDLGAGTAKNESGYTGPAWPFFIGADLNASDPLYPGLPSLTINETLPKVYLSGVQRTVNRLHLTNTTGEASLYWDKPTGALVEVSIATSTPMFSVDEHWIITDTNAWGRVTFTESGLQAGTRWYATLDDMTVNSTSDAITFHIKAGTYPFTVGAVEDHAPYSPSAAAVATPPSGTITVNNNEVHQTITFDYAVTAWDPVDDSYSTKNPGTVWASYGNCYGMSSTALLYFLHSLKDTGYPSLPSQYPQALSTSDLQLGDPRYTLTNASLAVTFHQLFDPNAYAPYTTPGVGSTPDEAAQYNSLIESLSKGNPVLLTLCAYPTQSHPALAFHEVVACGAGTLGTGPLAGYTQIYLYDSIYPGVFSNAVYNSTSDQFGYGVYSEFVLQYPTAISTSWTPPSSRNTESWCQWWHSWLDFSINGYSLVLTDRNVNIVSKGLHDYFTAPGDSQTFVCGIPGSSGIEEGSVQVYAIPWGTLFTISDPAPDQSTIFITRVQNASGQPVGYGYLLSATATQDTLNYTVAPSDSGLTVNADNALNANITFFTADQQDYSLFQASNLPVAAMQTANFTVTDWQTLNSTSQPSVTLQVSNANNQTEIATYLLTNGHNGLSSAVPEFPSTAVLLLLMTAVMCAATIYRKKLRRGRQVQQ